MVEADRTIADLGPLNPSAEASRTAPRALAVVLLGIAAVLLPVVGRPLPVNPSFQPVVLGALVLTAGLTSWLLILQFHRFGRLRLLVAAQAFWWTLITQAVAAFTIPGVVTADPLLGGPSSSGWLRVVWHVVVPVLLAAAFVPWPRTWRRVVADQDRVPVTVVVLGTSSVLAAAVAAACVLGESRLPVLLTRDLMTYDPLIAATAPLLAVIAASSFVVVWFGATRSIDRWFIPATAAVLADSVLAFLAGSRFTVGWYAGNTLVLVGTAIVLGALLGDMDAAYGRERAGAARLAAALDRADEAEARLRAALDASPDGFAMLDVRPPSGTGAGGASGRVDPGSTVRVVAMNAAFAGLLPEQRAPGLPVPLLDLDLPFDLPALRGQVLDALVAGSAISRVYELADDGTGEPAVGRAVVSPTADRTVVLAWRDETTAHQANQGLHDALQQARRARRALRDALDAADEGFAVLRAVPGPDGQVDGFTVAFVNRSGARMFRTTPQRLEDADLGDVVAAATSARAMQRMRACLAEGLPMAATLPLDGVRRGSDGAAESDAGDVLRLRVARLSEQELVVTFRREPAPQRTPVGAGVGLGLPA